MPYVVIALPEESGATPPWDLEDKDSDQSTKPLSAVAIQQLLHGASSTEKQYALELTEIQRCYLLASSRRLQEELEVLLATPISGNGVMQDIKISVWRLLTAEKSIETLSRLAGALTESSRKVMALSNSRRYAPTIPLESSALTAGTATERIDRESKET